MMGESDTEQRLLQHIPKIVTGVKVCTLRKLCLVFRESPLHNLNLLNPGIVILEYAHAIEKEKKNIELTYFWPDLFKHCIKFEHLCKSQLERTSIYLEIEKIARKRKDELYFLPSVPSVFVYFMSQLHQSILLRQNVLSYPLNLQS